MSRASSGASARNATRTNAANAHADSYASTPVSPDDADREAKARTALERANLPADLIESTKADPGAPFEHAEALAGMRAMAPADWARVKAVLRTAGVTIGDLERAMGTGEGGDGKPGRPLEFKPKFPGISGSESRITY